MKKEELKLDILGVLNNSFDEKDKDYYFLTSIIYFIDNYRNFAITNRLNLDEEEMNIVLATIYDFLINKATNEIAILFNSKENRMYELDAVQKYLQNFQEKDNYNVNKVKLIILAVISDASKNVSENYKSKGCYIATMVYGDYEHPQVKILREFRDKTLAKFSCGRYFIKIYYVYSPKLVERLRNKKIINVFIRKTLNQIIKLIK